MQHWARCQAAPIAPIKRIRADHIKRAGDWLIIFHREDQQNLIRHTFPKQAKCLPVEIGRAPFATARINIKLEE